MRFVNISKAVRINQVHKLHADSVTLSEHDYGVHWTLSRALE